jgi:hypothetical protein
MSGVVTVILFFISGVGSYRVFIVHATGCFVTGTKLGRQVGPIGSLGYLLALYLDFNNGPIISPHTKNYFVIVLIAFIAVNIMVHNIFKRMIIHCTQYQYFNECPSCHYRNFYLVGSCANCNYKKGDPLDASRLVVDMKLSEPGLIEHLKDPSIRLRLFLLLFLIIIAIYDLWQEYPNLKDWRFK